MSTMTDKQFTKFNTEGYSARELEILNAKYEELVRGGDSDSVRQYIAEQVLQHYDLGTGYFENDQEILPGRLVHFKDQENTQYPGLLVVIDVCEDQAQLVHCVLGYTTEWVDVDDLVRRTK